MTALLEISHLVVEMRRHHQWFRAVDEVSFSLKRGGSLGIVGESGCGKSVTLRAIMGLLPAAGRVHSGAVTVGGRLAMIFQDALSALNPVMRVGDQIAEAPRRVLGLSRSAARERALDLLRVVGIPDPARRYDSYPHELSGGLRQRVMMAIALSSEPAILLCDEPTTALDVTIQAQILALLSDLRASSGLSIIFVTHDLGVVGQVCDDLAVMYAGRIVETGPVAEVLASPRHPYTDALLASALDVDAADSEPVAIPGAVPDPCGRCLAARSSPAARWLSQTAGWRRFRSGSSRPGAAPPACTTKGSRATLVPGGRMADPRLEVENLSVSFHAGSGRMLRAVDGVSFRLAAGEVLGLVGESGCGKTSVARCVAGLLTPAAGTIRLDGADLAARRTVEQYRAIQMVFQDPYSSLNPRMTVRHVLRELTRVHELVPASGIEDRWRLSMVCHLSSPAASASGSPSRGRSRSNPGYSSLTSRSPRSMSQYRRRSSGCSRTCAPGSGSP